MANLDEPINAVNNKEAASDDVDSLAEMPLPFRAKSEGSLDARPVRRQTSYFSAINGGSTNNTIRDDDNPLNMSSSHLVMEASEASAEDELKSRGSYLEPGFWSSLPQILWERFRPSFFLDHLNMGDAIIVSRTWICVFVGSVLMVIDKTGTWIGAASYVFIIYSLIEVSGNISISHAFYTGLLDLILVLWGFLHCIIANAISWRMRGYPTSEQLLADLVEKGVCATANATCLLHEIHKGRYLTTKTTVIFFIAMVFALTSVGYGQMKFPPSIPAWIWSNIIIFITGAYLNMTPTFTPWSYGGIIVRPVGLAVSVRFVSAALWFPMSSNFKFIRALTGILKSANGTLSANFSELESTELMDPSLPKVVQNFEKTLSNSLSSFAVLKFDGMLSRGEFAYSRFDPGNLGELRALTRSLVTALSGPRFFYMNLLEMKTMIQQRKGRMQGSNDNSTDDSYDYQPHGVNSQSKEGALVPEEGSAKSDTSNQSNNAQRKHQTPALAKVSDDANVIKIHDDDPAPRMRERTETFSVSRAPEWVKKNSWLDKKLGKHYAQVAKFEESRLAHANDMFEHGIDVEDLEVLRRDVMAHYEDFEGPASYLAKELIAWIEEANKYRSWALFSPSYKNRRRSNQKLQNEKLVSAVTELQAVLVKRDKKFLEEWVHSLCKSGTVKSRQHYVYALTLDAQYSTIQQRTAEGLLNLASYCLKIDESRPEATLIFPFMKSLSRSPRFEKEYHSNDDMGADSAGGHDTPFDSISQVQVRSPDCSPPRTIMHLVGRFIKKVFNICTEPVLVFCIKRAIVAVSSCMLLFTRTTIFFAYKERIVWAPIMTGLSVTQRAVDGVYGFFVRAWYTLLGSVFGMVVWYTGSGHGKGNPYGIVASISGYMLILIFYRHYHNVAVPMGAIVFCVTTILVMGTGWTTTHGFSLDSEVGYGWSVAWRRFVLVVCGLTCGFIGSVLPHSTTAKKRLRVILGKCFEELGDIQAGIAGFMVHRIENPQLKYSIRDDLILRKIRSVKESVLGATKLVPLINLEPPIGGVWPKSRYLMLMKLVGDMTFILEDLHYLANRVESSSDIEALLQRSGWMSIELTSSLYSVLMLCTRALSSGQPLPSVTPGNLTEVYNRQLKSFFEFDVAAGETGLEGFMEDRYLSPDGRYALSFISAVSGLYRRLDTSMRLIKGLVGEIYAVNQSMLESEQEKTPLMWGRHEA